MSSAVFSLRQTVSRSSDASPQSLTESHIIELSMHALLLQRNSCSLHVRFAGRYTHTHTHTSGSVAEWSACWTQAQNGPGSNSSRDAVG